MLAAIDDDPEMIVWWGTEIECFSSIARREREGAPFREVARALERLDSLTAAWRELQPTERVRQTAKRLLRVHKLRAADALQVAAALVAAEDHPASLEFVSLDARLIDAARREGFAVLDVNAPNDRGP
jgi:uncharacterized protein